MLAKLDGYKTYILVGLGLAIVGLNVAGLITADQMNHMLEVIGLGSMATLRNAIAKNATAIADVKP